MCAQLKSDDAEIGRPPGYSGNKVRAVLRWGAFLPLALVTASLLVLEGTLFWADPDLVVRSASWPGSGSARDVALRRLDVLLMSGNSVLLSWLVLLDLLCHRSFFVAKETHRQILLAAGSAVILATLGAIGLGCLHRHEEAWFFFLFLCAPTLILLWAAVDGASAVAAAWFGGIGPGRFCGPDHFLSAAL